MSPFRMLLLYIGASSALVYHPSSLLQHRGTHVAAQRVNQMSTPSTRRRLDGVAHPTHWLICAQVLLSSEADEAEAEEPVAADPPAPAAAANDGGGVDGKLVVQGAAVAAMGAALYFLNTLPGPTSGWAAK